MEIDIKNDATGGGSGGLHARMSMQCVVSAFESKQKACPLSQSWINLFL